MHYPAIVRRIYNAGHTIGTHSQNHPLGFEHLAFAERGARRSMAASLRSCRARRSEGGGAVLPHSRPRPYQCDRKLPRRAKAGDLERRHRHQRLVARHHRRARSSQRAMRRLNAKGRGILLMHDIHPATAMALADAAQGAQGQRLSRGAGGGGGRAAASRCPMLVPAVAEQGQLAACDQDQNVKRAIRRPRPRMPAPKSRGDAQDHATMRRAPAPRSRTTTAIRRSPPACQEEAAKPRPPQATHSA